MVAAWIRRMVVQARRAGKVRDELCDTIPPESRCRIETGLHAESDMESVLADIAAAQRSYQTGDFDHAETLFRRVLDLDGKHTDALQGLAGIAYVRGEFREAIRWLAQAAAADPANPVIQNNLGAAYGATGQTSAAGACYEQALRLKPDYAEAHNNLGDALQQQEKLDEALASFAPKEPNQDLTKTYQRWTGRLGKDLGGMTGWAWKIWKKLRPSL